jgi:two-component sensor histidine kinase
MKLHVALILTIVIVYHAKAQTNNGDELTLLNRVIRQTGMYDERKLIRIETLHQAGHSNLFDTYSKLYEEYSLFRSDSAFRYAKEMQKTAYALKDPSLIAFSTTKLSFILLSTGMLKEAFDSLNHINPKNLSTQHKAEHFIVMARYYYTLSDHSEDKNYRDKYNDMAGRYIDSAQVSFMPGSFEYDYYGGLKNIRTLNFNKATELLRGQLNKADLSAHQVALAASTLSDIFIRNGQPDSAINLLTKAAISDIQSSTKETSAIFTLATLLFQQGDLENATTFIEKAASDANFYGSRQRKAQLNLILPLIKEEKIRTVEAEKGKILTYAIIITGSFGILIALTTIIVRQVRKLQGQQKLINQKNETLQHLVEEKEWLLKEIHHRVKNNLQTVVSLLESQSHYLEKDALLAVQNSQHRVFAMSLIHQKLYQTEKLGTVNMSVYLPELVNYLCDSFNVRQRIRFQLLVKNIELDSSQAVPLGLILNETITNAIKYAFPEKGNNEIVIAMDRTKNNQIELSISDNGVGMPSAFQINSENSLGMKLMKGLTEDLGGVLKISSDKGTKITVHFEPYAASHNSVAGSE